MRDTPDVRALRMQYSLSRQRMADIIGVSLNTITHWERGRRQPSARYVSVIRALPRRLERAGVPPDDRLPKDYRKAPEGWHLTLRQRRTAIGMSQQGLAELAGVRGGSPAICNYEAGRLRVSANVAARLEHVLSWYEARQRSTPTSSA